MILLALDTSTVACSVAVLAGTTVVERHEEQPREHTRILVPMIRSALDEAGVAVADLDAIVLGNGPGSFIGMRIAASVAQGLAYGTGVSVAPVSSLAAVAARAFDVSAAQEVVVAQDAHMNEVYLGVYGRNDYGLPVALQPERLHGLGEIAELGADGAGSRVAAGAGWERYPGLREANRARVANDSGCLLPRAADLIRLGADQVRAGKTVRPQEVVPAYLRNKVAEKPASRP